MITHKHEQVSLDVFCVVRCEVCGFVSCFANGCQVEAFMPAHLPHAHLEGDEWVYVVANDYPKVVIESADCISIRYDQAQALSPEGAALSRALGR